MFCISSVWLSGLVCVCGISWSYSFVFAVHQPHAWVQRGTGGLDLPRLENDKNIGFIAIPGSVAGGPMMVRFQCRAINGLLAKRHLNGVSLAGR